MRSIKPSLLLLALLVACGGRVVFDEPGGVGGSGSTSGSMNGSPTTSISAAASGSMSSGVQGCEQYGFNGIGTTCDGGDTICFIPGSCCGDMTARCANGIWVMESTLSCGKSCGPCFNGLSCDAGSLCVSDMLPNTTNLSSQCLKDPCANQPLNCECAQPVCAANSLTCLATGDQVVNCGQATD